MNKDDRGDTRPLQAGDKVIIAAPMFSRAQLESIVNGEVERHWLTREQADKLISDGRYLLREDGTPRSQPRSTGDGARGAQRAGEAHERGEHRDPDDRSGR